MGEIQMDNSKEDKNKWAIKACLDPSHNPPSHIVVPPGKTFKHQCPSIYTPAVWRMVNHNGRLLIDDTVYDSNSGRDIKHAGKESISFEESDVIDHSESSKRWYERLIQVSDPGYKGWK